MSRRLLITPLIVGCGCSPPALALPDGCVPAACGAACADVVCSPTTLGATPGALLTFAPWGDGAIVSAHSSSDQHGDGTLALVRVDGTVELVGATSGDVTAVVATDRGALWITGEQAGGLWLTPLAPEGPSLAPAQAQLIVPTTFGRGLASRGTQVAWTSADGGLMLADLDARTSAPIGVPPAYGDSTLALAPFGRDSFVFSRPLLCDVEAVRQDGGDFEVLFDGDETVAASGPVALAVDEEHVYFALSGRLLAAPLDGTGPAKVLATDLDVDVRGIASTPSGWIAWTETSRGELRALEPSTGATRTLASGLAMPAELHVGGGWLMWLDVETGALQRISTAALDGAL